MESIEQQARAELADEQRTTLGYEHCPRCKEWVELAGLDCRRCGKRLIREPSTAELNAEWVAKGYVQN
jgi:hypothetical protein